MATTKSISTENYRKITIDNGFVISPRGDQSSCLGARFTFPLNGGILQQATSTPPADSYAIGQPTYARGPKKHLKRLNAPKHWMLDKLTGTYAPRPTAGPHKLRECLPLVILIRNRLKYALNGKE
ncbi:40S ribosomal protein S4, X isoform, partial [Podila epicladia]